MNDILCGLTEPMRLPEGFLPRAVDLQLYIAVQHPTDITSEDVQVDLGGVASKFVTAAYYPAIREALCFVVRKTVLGLENRSQVLANLSRRCVSGWDSAHSWVLEVFMERGVFTVDWLCICVVFSRPCGTHCRIRVKVGKVERGNKRGGKRTEITSVALAQRLKFSKALAWQM